MKKKILLALGNEKFNTILRNALDEHFIVLTDEVYSKKYLEEFIEEQDPDIIIVHDYYLASDKDDPFEKEIEWLQTIENIRRKYDDDKRIVFICERSKGDPFLSELVNRNVLDIFHDRHLDIKQIIEQLLDQPRYSKVAYLKVEGSSKRYNSNVYKSPIFTETVDEEEIEEGKNVEENEKSKDSKKTIEEAKNKLKESISNFKLPKNAFSIKAKRTNKSQTDKETTVIEDKKDEKRKKSSLFAGNHKNTLQSIRPRLIAVGSLHPGAGSTFFIYNFTRYLADHGINSTVLEALNDIDALFALVGSESPPDFEWECVHNLIQMGNQQVYHLPKWTVEGTNFIPSLNVDYQNFKEKYAKDLIYYSRQTPIVFVDISHDWTDPISQEAIRLCDEIWCVTEPNPLYLEIQRKHHQYIYQVSNRIGEENIIIIGNKWEAGADITRFPELYIQIPYIPENIKALSNNIPIYRLKPKKFAMFFKLYNRLK